MNQEQEQSQLSTELLELINDITDNTLKIRNLFKQLDELVLKAGLSTDDIDLIIHNKYKELLKKSIPGVTVTNNSSYSYSHFK